MVLSADKAIPLESNDRNPSTSDTPSILSCPIHKKPLTHIADRTIQKKVDGKWIETEEPIIECVDCIFPPE